MTRWLLVALLAVACSSGSKKPAPQPLENTSGPDTPAQVPVKQPADDLDETEADELTTSRRAGDSVVVAEFAAITDNMCGCQVKACAEAVNRQFEAWMKRYQNLKGTKPEQERAKTLAEAYTKCMMHAMTGGKTP